MLGAEGEGFLYGVARLDDATAYEIRDAGTPVVLFNRKVHDPGFSAVVPDGHLGTVRGAISGTGTRAHRRTPVHIAGPRTYRRGSSARPGSAQSMRSPSGLRSPEAADPSR